MVLTNCMYAPAVKLGWQKEGSFLPLWLLILLNFIAMFWSYPHTLLVAGKNGVVCYHCFDILIEFYRQCFGATQLHVRSCWQLGCGGPYTPIKWGR